MAQLELQTAAAKTTRRRIHASLRIDMTPMVDLGFLLISFFIFTTRMSEPSVVSLSVPVEGPPASVKKSRSLSFILAGNNKVYAYEGQWEDALKNKSVVVTGFDLQNGIGKLIRAKQQLLQAHDEEGRDALTLLIKPGTKSSYKNLVDVLDETLINNVKRYAIVDLTAEEKEYTKADHER